MPHRPRPSSPLRSRTPPGTSLKRSGLARHAPMPKNTYEKIRDRGSPLDTRQTDDPQTKRPKNQATQSLRTPVMTLLRPAGGHFARGCRRACARPWLRRRSCFAGQLPRGRGARRRATPRPARQRCLADGRRAVILSGGELTVTVKATAAAGQIRNMPLHWRPRSTARKASQLSQSNRRNRRRNRHGPHDPAGAIIDWSTSSHAATHNLLPATFLENNNSPDFSG